MVDTNFGWPFSHSCHKLHQSLLVGMSRVAAYGMHLSTNDIAQPVNFLISTPRAKALDFPSSGAFGLVNPQIASHDVLLRACPEANAIQSEFDDELPCANFTLVSGENYVLK